MKARKVDDQQVSMPAGTEAALADQVTADDARGV